MINLDQFREHIVQPALREAQCWSKSAENMVIGVALVESGLRFLVQVKGPAKGLWQIESAPYDDVLKYIRLVPRRHQLCLSAAGFETKLPPLFLPPHDAVIYNLRWGAIIARYFFARFPEALPNHEDYEGMATLWKDRYNTSLGKGTVEKGIEAFKKACIPDIEKGHRL
jgi:hypothetical protein